MLTKSPMLYQGSRLIKLSSLLVALLFVFSACQDGSIDSTTNNLDSISSFESLANAAEDGLPANCKGQVNNNLKKLLDCVTLERVRAHQAAFQDIADANGGSRGAFTSGYDATTDYVEAVLVDAGYSIERQSITSDVYTVLSSSFEQVSPSTANYVLDTDYNVFTFSGSGDVAASLTAVDLDLGLGNNSTSGCEASDFVGFPTGNIALLQRGACSFFLKASNADAAGAVGVIIFNQGNTVEREVLFNGTLGNDSYGDIPVIATTYGLGFDLASSPGVFLAIEVNSEIIEFSADNLLAELPGKNSANVVMAGAVLDSPGATPGINNNGSGAAAVLETAVRMAKVKPQNTVRFAWWADNSTNLEGSFEYVNSLTPDELQQIALYLNFDVIGSPNYVNFVYDGDNSDGGNSGFPPTPAGSDVIEDLFEDYYSDIGQPTKSLNLNFFSASIYFLDSGIPSGGIFSGSFELKTPDEEAIWGGIAGEQYDPCALLACDTFDNVNLKALEFNSDAVAYAILNTAMNTSLINGEKAKGNFKPKTDKVSE